MNNEELKQVQAPIKDRYRNNPQAAWVTICSEGIVDVTHQHCSISSFAGKIRAGLHPAAGGSDADACSAELLLESLIACAGVTLSAVATNMDIAIESCRIEAQADMDFRGTLGVDRTAPVGIVGIRMQFHIQSKATAESIAKLISLTERYCVIYQTLRHGVSNIEVRHSDEREHTIGTTAIGMKHGTT